MSKVEKVTTITELVERAETRSRKEALLPLRKYLMSDAKFMLIHADPYVSLGEVMRAIEELEETGKIELTA